MAFVWEPKRKRRLSIRKLGLYFSGLRAWCAYCHDFQPADSGPDPLVPGRITEILRDHRRGRWSLRKCPGSGRDADPVA